MDVGQMVAAKAWIEGLHWSAIKSTLELMLYFLAVFAVFGCLRRIKTIREVIREFNEGRGRIWDFRTTVERAASMAPVVDQMHSAVGKIEPTIEQLKEQVERLEAALAATRKQMAEWQIDSISGRTGSDTAGPDTGDRVAQISASQGVGDNDDDANWEKLRYFWRRNTERLEYVIENIRDGRRRLAFDRVPRTKYSKIINRLEAGGHISPEAVTASRKLDELFVRHRNRRAKVQSEMLGPVALLDEQLEKAIVEYARTQEDFVDETPSQAERPPAAVRTGELQSFPSPLNGAHSSGGANSLGEHPR